MRNTWPFVQNSPVFWGLSTARGRKEPAGLSHSAKVKIAAGGLLGFPPAHEIYNAHKAPLEDYFFCEMGQGRRKKGFFPALWLQNATLNHLNCRKELAKVGYFNAFLYLCAQTCTVCRYRFNFNKDSEVQLILRMKAKKILYITQEMVPYVSESQMATIGRELPQGIQESGHEIRTFMPKWGNINERRNQLHEVIRLSGMNIVIDETDHPLIIKVASIQAARIQVYFIDNDDYFYKRQMRADEDGTEYADNAERAIFYARGVLETVKKLRWVPDVIHCHGWISSIVPFYIKKAFCEEPTFAGTKVVYSAYEDTLTLAPRENFPECVDFREAKESLLAETGIDFSTPQSLDLLGAHFADGVVQLGSSSAVAEHARAQGIPVLEPSKDSADVEAYANFYEQIVGGDAE